jgi:hypothetical protein
MKVKDCCKNYNAVRCSKMFLDLHETDVEFVDSQPADLVIFDHKTPNDLWRSYPGKFKLCLDVQHASADKHRFWARVPWIAAAASNEFAIIECEDPGFAHNRILFYDFLWNRSKAYYTGYQWSNARDDLWYYHTADSFRLQPISSATQKTRLFLSPNKDRIDAVFRSRLADTVLRHDLYRKGYASFITWKIDGTTELHGNRNNPDAVTVADAIKPPLINVEGYDPVHNAYYNETFFSTYVETFETGTSQFVTEKTLDPLIKGHFILPFSTAGFIAYLKKQGWRLPTFIDYSYDTIANDELRFRAFREELFRLSLIRFDTWCQLWTDNMDILQHNRNQLNVRPFDKLSLLEHLL